MQQRRYYFVMIHHAPGKEAKLRSYENEIKPVLERHGGRFEFILRPDPIADMNLGQELHLVSFADEAGFQSFGADPDTVTLRKLRDAVVERISLVPVTHLPLEQYFLQG